MLQATEPIPALHPNSKVESVNFPEDFEGKHLAILFYPYDFDSIALQTLNEFNDRVEEFRDLNCQFLSCSTDSTYGHLAWLSANEGDDINFLTTTSLKFVMLADKTCAFTESLDMMNDEDGVARNGVILIDNKWQIRNKMVEGESTPKSLINALRTLESENKKRVDSDVKILISEYKVNTSSCCSMS